MKKIHIAGIAGIVLIIFCVTFLSLLATSNPAEKGWDTFVARPVDAVYMRTITESSARSTIIFPFNSTHTFTITEFRYVLTWTSGIAVPTTFVKAANLPPPDHYTWSFTGWMVFIGFGCLVGLIFSIRGLVA